MTVASRPEVEQAADLFQRAVEAHLSRDLDTALTLYRRILVIAPHHAECLNNAGAILAERGHREKARELLQRAIEAAPAYGEALNNLGLLCSENGQYADAYGYFRHACDLEPGNADWLNNLGNACCELKRFAEALGAYDRAIAVKSREARFWSNRGIALRGLQRPDEAIESFERAVQIDPGHVNAWSNMGSVFREAKMFDRAITAFRRALDIEPRNAALVSNYATVFEHTGDHEQMANLARQALSLDPGYAEAYTLLANHELEAGRYDAAEQLYGKAIELDPRNRNANWNLAIIWLLRGDYEAGWRQFEWRRQLHSVVTAHMEYPAPEWDGSPLEGRTILLATEQGIGDVIQFIRYAAELKRMGAGRVMVECPWPLAPLLDSVPGVDQAVARGAPLPGFDTWAHLMSLPFLFGTTLESIPASVPYVFAEPRPAAAAVIDEPDVLKVGIAWSGNPMHQRDYLRSVEPSRFLPFRDIPGIRLYSLQKGAASEQQLSELGQSGIIDLGPHLGDFRDTAAAIAKLDLVITVDTSVAHLAAAMGKPTWILLTHVPDYRWMLERNDSPWYPTARLFRQHRPRQWDEVFRAVTDELRATVETGAIAAEYLQQDTNDDMVTVLEAATRLPDGRPRFDCWIPLARLADPSWFAEYEAELVAGGFQRPLREFWDEVAHSVDVIVDLTPGIGTMLLSLMTASRTPGRIIAVEPDDCAADRLRSLANGRAHGDRVTVVTGPAAAHDLIRRDGFRRIGVHSTRSQALREFAAACRTEEECTLNLDVVTCASGPDDGLYPAWKLVPEWEGLTPFRVSFEGGEVQLDPLPKDAGDTDVAWLSTSVLERLQGTGGTEAPEASAPVRSGGDEVVTASSRRSPPAASPTEIGIEWELRSDTGWGIYGINLALELLKRDDFKPAIFSVDPGGIGPLASWRLGPIVHDAMNRRMLLQRSSQPVSFEGVMLRAWGNNMAGSPLHAAVAARRNAGVIFFEDTHFDPAARERARSQNLMIAGSSWNADVLRSLGLTNVTTVFQGIDPTIFHPAPRSGLLDGRFVVFSGGKLEYRKGQDIVVAVFRAFQQRHPEALLLTAWHNNWPNLISDLELAGHVSGVPAAGHDGMKVSDWLASNGVPTHAVLDLGRLPNPLMGAVLRDADVAFFPNRCEGGTNLVAMECMAAGVPTIVSANTGHMDLLRTGGCVPLSLQSKPRHPSRFYSSVEGWGESDVEEGVELLEAIHADRVAARALGESGAAAMRDWTWQRQIGRLMCELGKLT